jgi:hypothetical protein
VERDSQGDSHTVEIFAGPYRGTLRVAYTDDRLEITPLKLAGGDAPRVKQVWERRPREGDFPSVASDPPAQLPASLSTLKNLTGMKWIEGQLARGQQAVGTGVGQWILDGKFFLYTGSFTCDDQSVVSHLLVAGTDPDTGKATGWEFGSDGSVGKFVMADDGYSLTGREVEADGSIFEFSGSFVMEGDAWKYTATGKTEANLSMPYQWQWRDVK